MSVEIRRVQAGDEILFNRVALDVFDEPVHPDRLKAYLLQPGHLMIVAIRDNEIVGQCAAVVHRHPDKVTELYIDEVGVGINFRRQGIAKRMLEDMFEWGKSLGCEEAWLGTEPDNQAARALYDGYNPQPIETFVMYLYELNESD